MTLAKEVFSKKYTFQVTKENETQIEVPFEFLSKEEMASDYDMKEPLGRIVAIPTMYSTLPI